METFILATHSRLGADSPVQMLSMYLIADIINLYSDSEPMGVQMSGYGEVVITTGSHCDMMSAAGVVTSNGPIVRTKKALVKFPGFAEVVGWVDENIFVGSFYKEENGSPHDRLFAVDCRTMEAIDTGAIMDVGGHCHLTRDGKTIIVCACIYPDDGGSVWHVYVSWLDAVTLQRMECYRYGVLLYGAGMPNWAKADMADDTHFTISYEMTDTEDKRRMISATFEISRHIYGAIIEVEPEVRRCERCVKLSGDKPKTMRLFSS